MPNESLDIHAFDEALSSVAPGSLASESDIPTRPLSNYTPSPSSWQQQVLYFLLPDRFSDERDDRPLVRVDNLDACRPANFDLNGWAQSGSDRWQGGTIRGITKRLDYLEGLGVSALWIAPVFRQRTQLNSFHGYGIQDFLEVDPRLGTRRDLAELVKAAHDRGMRILLDIVFNHTGTNWMYRIDGQDQRWPAYLHWPSCYPFGRWLDARERTTEGALGREDGVWPRELQNPDVYTRAGEGDLGESNVDWAHAEHKRTDFRALRDVATDKPEVLRQLALLFKYWIAVSDCDGFRLDTVKHVSKEEARNFCGAIKEYAARLGKDRFLLLGEVAGGDEYQDKYLDALEQNLDAVLDIGSMRLALCDVAKGLRKPEDYFNGFQANTDGMGSHRFTGCRHVSITDDHDHVMGRKLRFSAEIPESLAVKRYQVAAGAAIQLLSLGIPCIYYGSEQALGGPEAKYRSSLDNWGGHDRYLREAMFGPEHPRLNPANHSMAEQLAQSDGLPGFGPFGTAGYHCFDTKSPAYRRIAALTRVRREHRALWSGRQYLRQVRASDTWPFPDAGGLIPWARILDASEYLCVVNANALSPMGGKIVVDVANPVGSKFTVLVNTAEAGGVAPGPHTAGSTVTVRRDSHAEPAYVEVAGLPPAETLVLYNGR